MVFHLSNRPGLFSCFPYAPPTKSASSQQPESLGCRKGRAGAILAISSFQDQEKFDTSICQHYEVLNPPTPIYESWSLRCKFCFGCCCTYTVVSLAPVPD